ncbi:MAG: hypothetical protein RL616_2562, partial [Verrucomicrobiota bacterium]
MRRHSRRHRECASNEFDAVKIKTNNLKAFTLIEMILAIGVASLVLIAANMVL